MAKQLAQGKQIKAPNVRLSFAQLHEAAQTKGFPDSPEKFSCSFIFDPKNPAHAKVIKEIREDAKRMIIETWGSKPPKMKEITCFGPGEQFISGKTGEPYTGYAGMWAVSANNSNRPMLKGRNKQNLSPEEAEKVLYSGCYVNAIFKLWVQDNEYGKAIRCSLDGVMFFGDGEAFGVGGADDEDFDDFEAGEMSDELDGDDSFDLLDDADDFDL